jgi:hypothetical protein
VVGRESRRPFLAKRILRRGARLLEHGDTAPWLQLFTQSAVKNSAVAASLCRGAGARFPGQGFARRHSAVAPAVFAGRGEELAAL